jgi:cob(I)alamin adenosyltransferase
MAKTVHRGDGGETQLPGGHRVRKDDPRIECVGSLDELSSYLGLARAVLAAGEAAPARPEAEALLAWLARIQHELYLLGAQVARREGTPATAPVIAIAEVQALDGDIEQTDAALPKLRSFILPGGGVAAAHLHVARAICRRAERQAVALAAAEPLAPEILSYLNRLSLALFSMARRAAFLAGNPDEPA